MSNFSIYLEMTSLFLGSPFTSISYFCYFGSLLGVASLGYLLSFVQLTG
jgi:hypothetical protein